MQRPTPDMAQCACEVADGPASAETGAMVRYGPVDYIFDLPYINKCK